MYALLNKQVERTSYPHTKQIIWQEPKKKTQLLLREKNKKIKSNSTSVNEYFYSLLDSPLSLVKTTE